MTNRHFARRAVSDMLRLIDTNNQVVEIAKQRATRHCPTSSNSSGRTTRKKMLDLGVRRFEVCPDASQGIPAKSKAMLRESLPRSDVSADLQSKASFVAQNLHINELQRSNNRNGMECVHHGWQGDIRVFLGRPCPAAAVRRLDIHASHLIDSDSMNHLVI